MMVSFMEYLRRKKAVAERLGLPPIFVDAPAVDDLRIFEALLERIVDLEEKLGLR